MYRTYFYLSSLCRRNKMLAEVFFSLPLLMLRFVFSSLSSVEINVQYKILSYCLPTSQSVEKLASNKEYTETDTHIHIHTYISFVCFVSYYVLHICQLQFYYINTYFQRFLTIIFVRYIHSSIHCKTFTLNNTNEKSTKHETSTSSLNL